MVLLAVGMAGSLRIERRRVHLRNRAGRQGFAAFGASLATGTSEGLALLGFQLMGFWSVAELGLAAFKMFGR